MPTQAKKVLIVCHYYPPHIGGIEIVAFNQAKQLVKVGYEVIVVTSKVSTLERADSIVDGVRVIRIKALNYFEKWGVPFPIFCPKLIWVLFGLTKRVDIIHVHDSFYISSLIATLCGRWFKKPIVLTQHVAMVKHPNRLVVFFQKIVYATSGKIIFTFSHRIAILNDRVEKFLIKNGVSEHKIISLPNGVDTEIFHPVNNQEKIEIRKELGLSQNKRTALFVGRFVPKKGFDKVLESCDKNYQIVFAGGESSVPAPYGAIFLGKLDQLNLAKVYQSADIFVLPSQDEGFPLSVQEAMASGLPVITTDDEGYERYNLDKDKVSLIKNPTGELVKQEIKSIIHNDSRIHEMSRYSYKYALDYFSWPIVIQKLTAIYNDLVKEK